MAKRDTLDRTVHEVTGQSMETAFLTPSFGFNLFRLRPIVPKSTTMTDICKSVLPVAPLQALALVLMIVFPGRITRLPCTLLR